MSSSIAIPRRKHLLSRDLSSSSGSFSSSSSSSDSSSTTLPPLHHSIKPYHASTISPVSSSPASPSSTPTESKHHRRASFMSSSIAKTEHTVIDVGAPDAPRLITCIKASQGFDWNPELFLPSYMDRGHAGDLERKRDPICDVVLTDEEAAALLPN